MPGVVCTEYGSNAALCYDGPAAEYAANCEAGLSYYRAYGAACRAAVEDYFACLGTVDCGSFKSGCAQEREAIDVACL